MSKIVELETRVIRDEKNHLKFFEALEKSLPTILQNLMDPLCSWSQDLSSDGIHKYNNSVDTLGKRRGYGSLSQLQYQVWRQWRKQTQLSLLDPSIKENYSESEVIRCIQQPATTDSQHKQSTERIPRTLSLECSCAGVTSLLTFVNDASKKAKNELTTECSSSQQAVIWYDDCTVRYSNISFFHRADTSPAYTMPSLANVSDPENFSSLLHLTLNETVGQASSNDKKFATTQANVSGSQSLYCLAQCTPDLSPSDCKTCLSAAIRELPSCCEASEGGRVLYPSCNVRYELYPFFDSNSSSTQTPPWVPASHFSFANSTYLHHNCSSDHEPADTAFKRDLNTLLSHMSSNAAVAYTDNVERSMNGLFICRGDVPCLLCQQCVVNATRRISSLCNSSRQAIIWFSYCMLRYSDIYFFSKLETSPFFQVFNVTTPSTHVPTRGFFNDKLSNTIEKRMWQRTQGTVM
ncbi:hypothetical protein Fmac_029013 [Flemingia macrophylla]|uniref:Gnk2-homologous domain-containing protein n=1 Tax=Flemingia macrophylla TaxID=520843 RepID=A0ABD1L956_9FABA